MNYEQLKHHASSCQMAADEMAIQLIHIKRACGSISVLEGICDFGENLTLAQVYEFSPEVVLHVDSLHFLAENVRMFTRKLKVAEMLSYDFIIRHHEIKTFEQFKETMLNNI